MGISADRRWMIGGGLAAVLLFLAAWFLLIHPQNEQTYSLNAQADAAQARLALQVRRLGELREQSGRLNEFESGLRQACEALPSTSAMPAFLKQLHAAEAATDVIVSGLVVGDATDATASVYALPVTVTAQGRPAALNRFVEQVQQEQPRAVLVSQADAVTDLKTGTQTLTLTAQVFVADRTGSGGDACAAASPAVATS